MDMDSRNVEKAMLIEPYINSKTAAHYLGMTLKGLYAQIDTGRIPSELVHRLGRGYRFRRSELSQLITRGRLEK